MATSQISVGVICFTEQHHHSFDFKNKPQNQFVLGSNSNITFSLTSPFPKISCSLFETSQSLFWASFGLIDLVSFELTGTKEFTRFWALLMFGSYSVINVIVLLNMLIAMMSNSYQIISERADIEWKFARSRLWVSYFDDGDTLPPPFNVFPTRKHMCRCKSGGRITDSFRVGPSIVTVGSSMNCCF